MKLSSTMNRSMRRYHSTQSQYELMLTASKEVDFDNVEDAFGYATLIFSAANEAGVISGVNRQSREAVKITQLAKEWVINVEKRIGEKSPNEVLMILEPFDFMHRIAYRTAAQDFIDHNILAAFEAYINGDKTVNEYYLYFYIRQQIVRKNTDFFGQPLKWYLSTLERWFNRFKSGASNEPQSDYDTIEIVNSLLTEDLFAFVGSKQDTFKKKLFDNHRHYLDELDGLGNRERDSIDSGESDRFSYRELVALSNFLKTSGKYLSKEERAAFDHSLLCAQLAHPDINRFYRLSLEHELFGLGLTLLF